MDCNLTEEVSLLVDGELAPDEAARLRAHVEACAACRQAHDAFLLLRQELRAYEPTPDPHAQRAVLAAILNSRASKTKVSRLSERLAGLFGVGRLRPAYAAALALLLVAALFGLRWLAGPRTSPNTPRPDAPALANTNSRPVKTASATKKDEEKSPHDSDAVGGQVISQSKSPNSPRPTSTAPSRASVAQTERAERLNAQLRRDGYRTPRRRPEGLNRDSAPDSARTFAPPLPPSSALPPSAASAVALYAAAGAPPAAADPASRIGRHAERVERLLRSFRNARLTEGDPTLDLADARRLSKRLLYSNIALRREAAGASDPSAEGLLDSVEPILLDIANLPNRPSPDAVGSIKERIRRRQLVGVLQAQAMLASKP